MGLFAYRGDVLRREWVIPGLHGVLAGLPIADVVDPLRGTQKRNEPRTVHWSESPFPALKSPVSGAPRGRAP